VVNNKAAEDEEKRDSQKAVIKCMAIGSEPAPMINNDRKRCNATQAIQSKEMLFTHMPPGRSLLQP
jgi:hypothetical protein